LRAVKESSERLVESVESVEFMEKGDMCFLLFDGDGNGDVRPGEPR